MHAYVAFALPLYRHCFYACVEEADAPWADENQCLSDNHAISQCQLSGRSDPNVYGDGRANTEGMLVRQQR